MTTSHRKPKPYQQGDTVRCVTQGATGPVQQTGEVIAVRWQYGWVRVKLQDGTKRKFLVGDVRAA